MINCTHQWKLQGEWYSQFGVFIHCTRCNSEAVIPKHIKDPDSEKKNLLERLKRGYERHIPEFEEDGSNNEL